MKGDIARPPKKRRSLTVQAAVPPTKSKSSTVNLCDWIDTSILAKDGIHYYPGIIKSVPSPTSIEVLLDRHNEPQTFCDILDNNDAILSNHSAPAIMIKQGLAVCVKSKPTDLYFSVGSVKELRQGPPMQCLVQIPDALTDELWVSRAAIRLLQPPWYDDLVDTGGQEVCRSCHLSLYSLLSL